jgi:hypothetical protein
MIEPETRIADLLAMVKTADALILDLQQHIRDFLFAVDRGDFGDALMGSRKDSCKNGHRNLNP